MKFYNNADISIAMMMMNKIPVKKQTLSPCAGRCSTVFGDHVCRGCRRFNHEVIHWNNYTEQEKYYIWQRLDKQIDQVLLPLIPYYDLDEVEYFLKAKGIHYIAEASVGRKLYLALRLCEKNPEFLAESGLEIPNTQIKPIWKAFEAKVLRLAQASYELYWLRAEHIYKGLNGIDCEIADWEL